MPAVKTTTKKNSRKPAKKVTINDVWAIIADIGKVHKETEQGLKEVQEELKKTQKGLRESHQETEKALRESHQETEKALREFQQETEKALREFQQETERTLRETQKELNKAIGGLSNTLGSLVEHIMTPGLPGKFRQFGFTFDKVTTVKWAAAGSIYAEIDGLLENGSQAMVVEVKTTLNNEDTDEHLERMEKIRKYADEHGDRRQFFGAMAATITSDSTRQYALKKGFFLIEPAGEDVKITEPVSKPRVW